MNYDRNERGRDLNRGPLERGTDEVRSWFGDNDAERRRHMDERRDDLRGHNRYDSNERGPIERGTDEVRSWFGDNDAERRRHMDERRDDLRGRNRYDSNERGPIERGTDEVRSWFGDNDAERRRHMDERRDDTRGRFDYDRGSDYRHNYGSQSYDSDRVRTDLNRNSSNWGSGDNRYSQSSGYGQSGSYGHGSSFDRERENSYGRSNLYGQGGSSESHRQDRRDEYGSGRSTSGSSYGSYGSPSSHGSGSSYRSSFNYEQNRESDRGLHRGGDHERGMLDRAGDEVRSWFGDNEAERRRQMDVWRDVGYSGDNYVGNDPRFRDNDRERRGW